ncbi:transcriptional regulator [Marilutibacter maris]|uniref:transcriptional regulator n=1 Tax=Marilutibacter maris TaxID=1605891 RepID=UPI000DA812CA|nr:winged helix-turn-helix domain-containing protein [Lysobacter maris]
MSARIRPSWLESDARYLKIDDLVIDLNYRRMFSEEGEINAPQRALDLLLLLVKEPNRLHYRADLLEALWPGLIVEDANLSQSVWLLRKALGPERKSWLRTVAGAGYVFEPPTEPETLATLPWNEDPDVGPDGSGPDAATSSAAVTPSQPADEQASVSTPSSQTVVDGPDPCAAPASTRWLARFVGSVTSYIGSRLVLVFVAMAVSYVLWTVLHTCPRELETAGAAPIMEPAVSDVKRDCARQVVGSAWCDGHEHDGDGDI